MTLEGQQLAVFGGSSGIGLATAQAAAKAGAGVTLISRSADKLGAAAKTIVACETAALDVTDSGAVAAFFDEREVFDHVVVTAAALDPGPLRSQSLATARAAMESKFWGAVNVAHAARITDGGSLTLVSGMLGKRPAGGATILSAINAGLDALAQALALELAPTRVNCVSPGRVDSSWWDYLSPEDRKALLDSTAAKLPVKRIGQPEDIAQAIIAAMTNTFMTGAVLMLDGGGQLV
ncbi:MAG: SDR family oxidoreductase [Maritimibacter sp.]|uniref:SDR family oxidoreductase n=1 Tax=Maritimibacter sp. TaxID=2003363 RepID=UPI001DDA8836|nr:SDR family oxidoreductase [Maritimibacter sp.]MBL6425896.1 SDR family oxidoreductase [Maritimibacter sp.]